MAFDYKKEYKEFYLPGKKPQLVEVPKMNYIAVRGKGNPNEESLCVQCMHMGAFDEEHRTIALMDAYLRENGYENDFSNGRMHHEIYLSDARRVPQEKWRTVIRHPVRKI